MSVIEFPGPARDENGVHAEAFRDLEGHISDCACMASIAAQYMSNSTCQNDNVAFAVFHLTEMIMNLQKCYKAAWAGEDAFAYRLIRHPAKSTREIKEAYALPPITEPDAS